MSEFILYGIPGSPYLRSALMVLEEKSQPWRLVPLRPGEHKTPQHLERHPFGRIPVLEHDGFRLYETQAILRYVERLFPAPSLTPADPRQEARMNQICGINDWYVMPNIGAGIVFGRVIAPRLGFPFDEAKIAASLPAAEICVAELARLLGDHEFLAGPTLSLADLLLAPQLAFLPLFAEGLALLAPHPRLGAWIERMEQRPSMVRTEWNRLAAECQVAA
jgi:glutathione S-transferase